MSRLVFPVSHSFPTLHSFVTMRPACCQVTLSVSACLSVSQSVNQQVEAGVCVCVCVVEARPFILHETCAVMAHYVSNPVVQAYDCTACTGCF